MSCPTKRSKKLNKAILQEKSVGRLTKTRRHTYPQHDADELGTFLWQTRSLKGYSFLNGVAYCATNGWIILIGDHGAAREGMKPISNALPEGEPVCLPFAVYSHCAPVSSRKEDDLHSPEVQLTVGTHRVFRAFAWLWAFPVSTASPRSHLLVEPVETHRRSRQPLGSSLQKMSH
jgi:hypothetical protein